MTIAEQIDLFKDGRKLPDITVYNEQWDPKKHQIFKNRLRYPDRVVKVDEIRPDGTTGSRSVTIALNRVGLPFQKKIVNIARTFFCGIPVRYTNNIPETDLYDAFIKVLDKVKYNHLDGEVFTACARFTECAELWYHVDEPNTHYGFNSKFRAKVKILTPDKYNLYPKFDDNDDLIAFSREWKEGQIEYFEAYTAESTIKYKKENGEWQIISDLPQVIGKIPIVYYKQDQVEWHDVQDAIERIEHIYSSTAESNDRFAFPILGLWGEVQGQLSQDRSGRVLQFEKDAKGQFIEQPDASASLSKELERLERDTHDFTSTPNISFDNMKGLGNMLAGESAEFLFLSAHLKVMDKIKIFVPGFERRASIVKSYLQLFNVNLKQELDVTPVVTPFVINNDAAFIKLLLEANGNMPIFSQKYSMEKYGIDDPEQMQEEIQREATQRIELGNGSEF